MIQTLRKNALSIIFAPLILLTACTSPSDKLTKELKTVSSWSATVRMVGEALMGGEVPDAYAKRTLDTAAQNLEDESKTLSNSSDLPGDERARAQEQVGRIRQLVGQTKAAVEGKDRSALAQLIAQLMIEEQAVKSSIKDVSGQR
ncbi:MAG: hypothetical protein M3362_16185 [Acidobacteriota bacterium]|nr:hypothetical protein [Acidobacteriota bacterium]